jgi:rod shape-determining protein MreD
MTTTRSLNPAIFAALASLAVLTLLQEGVVPQLTIQGARPDLVLLAVIDWGLIRGVEEAMLWGFIGGIFVDVFSGLPFGTSSTAYVAVAGMVSLGETALMRTHVLLPVVAAVVGTVIYYAVALIIVASVRHEFLLSWSFARVVVGIAGFNAVVNSVLYGLAHAFDRRLRPVARTSW